MVQQHQGRVAPTGREQGQAVNRDPSLEREADTMGARPSEGDLHADNAPAPFATAREVHAQPVLQMDGKRLNGLIINDGEVLNVPGDIWIRTIGHS